MKKNILLYASFCCMLAVSTVSYSMNYQEAQLMNFMVEGKNSLVMRVVRKRGIDAFLMERINPCAPPVRSVHTALTFAVFIGNLDIVKALVQAGADIKKATDTKKQKTPIMGKTPLEIASDGGDTRVVDYLKSAISRNKKAKKIKERSKQGL